MEERAGDQLNMSKAEERFWSKVDKRGPEECWEWTRYSNARGYGKFRLNDKSVFAHRVAWEMSNGTIPNGLCVCHTCDNPSCCNPAHLSLGTPKDNMCDARDKGRMSKLAESDVLCVRYWLKKGHTQEKIAEAFGVSRATVGHIKTGVTWGYLQ